MRPLKTSLETLKTIQKTTLIIASLALSACAESKLGFLEVRSYPNNYAACDVAHVVNIGNLESLFLNGDDVQTAAVKEGTHSVWVTTVTVCDGITDTKISHTQKKIKDNHTTILNIY